MPTPLLLPDFFGDACPVGQTVVGNCVTLKLPIINHDSTAMASIGSTALITRQSQVLRQLSCEARGCTVSRRWMGFESRIRERAGNDHPDEQTLEVNWLLSN